MKVTGNGAIRYISFPLQLRPDKIWTKNVKCSSKIKMRLQAKWVVSSDELCILPICIFSPMNISVDPTQRNP